MFDIRDLFEEELELRAVPSHSYDEYKVLSVNGVEPAQDLWLWYYYDEVYLPFDHRTPGLKGKLCIWVPSGYSGTKAGGEVRFFDSRSAADGYRNSEYAFVEGEDRISILDLLTYAFQCTFPNGNHGPSPVNDYDESHGKALEVLGTNR